MVNDLNRFYMLARRLNRNSIEVKFFFNLIDTTKVVNKSNYYNKFFGNKDILTMHYKDIHVNKDIFEYAWLN